MLEQATALINYVPELKLNFKKIQKEQIKDFFLMEVVI